MESSVFGDQIAAALLEAHVNVKRYPPSPVIKMTGVMICFPNLRKFTNLAEFNKQLLAKESLYKVF
jgi:hypothetical protein